MVLCLFESTKKKTRANNLKTARKRNRVDGEFLAWFFIRSILYIYLYCVSCNHAFKPFPKWYDPNERSVQKTKIEEKKTNVLKAHIKCAQVYLFDVCEIAT